MKVNSGYVFYRFSIALWYKGKGLSDEMHLLKAVLVRILRTIF